MSRLLLLPARSESPPAGPICAPLETDGESLVLHLPQEDLRGLRDGDQIAVRLVFTKPALGN